MYMWQLSVLLLAHRLFVSLDWALDWIVYAMHRHWHGAATGTGTSTHTFHMSNRYVNANGFHFFLVRQIVYFRGFPFQAAALFLDHSAIRARICCIQKDNEIDTL